MQRQRLFSATLVAVVVLSLLADSAHNEQPVNPGDTGLSSATAVEGMNKKREIHEDEDNELPDEDQQPGNDDEDQPQPGGRAEDQQLDEDSQQSEDSQQQGEEPQLADKQEDQQLGNGNEYQQLGEDQQQGDGDEDQQLGDEEEETVMAGDDDDDPARSDNGKTKSDSSQICSIRRAPGLPRGRIGDTANGSCHSGLFNGVWYCDYSEERNDTRWQLTECRAPEDLQFAGSSDFFSSGVAGALRTVRDHFDNDILDLSTAISLVGEISSIDLDESNSFAIEQDTEVAFGFLSSLLKQSRSLTKQERAHSTSKLLRSLDLLALKYVQRSTYFDLGFVKMNIKGIDPGSDTVGIQVGQNSIILPTSDLQDALNYSSVKEVSFWFEDLSTSLLDNETAEGQVITPVISTALLCGNTLCNTSKLNLSRPIKIILEQQSDLKIDSTETLQCSYWELETLDTDHSFTGYWSQRGCTLNRMESTGGRIVCECTHLTHFAVLLSPGAKIGQKHVFALSLVGYIGVPLSLVAMAITALIYGCCRSLWNMRSYIHINLCLSLMAAQFLFLVGIDRTENQIGCSIVAVALHYLFLVSFMWMLMEGVVLYVVLVKVFVEGLQRRYIIGFTIASYGLPALYMCFTVPLGFLLNGERHYGSDTMCWLRYDTHFVWTFITPVILIIVTNMVLFIMVFVIIHKHHHVNNLATIRRWIKPGISLMTVMGLTWITGLLVFDEALIPFAYVFTIFVALQGLAIFILFVVMSNQVRETILKYMRNNLKMEFLKKYPESKTKEVTYDRSGGTWLRKEPTLQYCQGSPRLSGQGSTLTLNH